MRKKDYVALYKRENGCKKIAVENGKGGCGKTSTCLALGMHLARMGNDVLYIDADPQANLSQRLGIHDDDFTNRRIDNLFTAINHSHPEEALNDLPIVVQYRYNYKLAESEKKVGRIAIVAGRNTSEIEAVATQAKMAKKTDDKDIFEKFGDALNYYGKYFDYILIDTAPNLENNLLCDLVTRNVDHIICPIDGLEAARGVRNLISYVRSRTSRQRTQPEIFFTMVKYQKDLKADSNEPEELTSEKVPNAVYRVLKEFLTYFMCDNAIPELASLKNKVYGGFGRKTAYDELCQELAEKINTPIDANILDFWGPVLSEQLNETLNEIESRSLGDRKPSFKYPYFSEKTRAAEPQTTLFCEEVTQEEGLTQEEALTDDDVITTDTGLRLKRGRATYRAKAR